MKHDPSKFAEDFSGEPRRLGVSACLLGHHVRYNSELKQSPFIREIFGPHFELVPVCPEVEFGLPVPRDPMHLQGDSDHPRMIVTDRSQDLTDRFLEWTEKRVEQLHRQGLCGYIFKTRSPSCGMREVPVLQNGRWINTGVGLFARTLMERMPFLPTEDNERLLLGHLREYFWERVNLYQQWRIMTLHRDEK